MAQTLRVQTYVQCSQYLHIGQNVGHNLMLVIGCVALRCHVEILCYTALEALVNDSQLNLIFYVIYPSSAYLSFALSIRPKSGPEPLMDCRTLALRNEHRRPRSATKMLRAISAHGTKPSSPHRLIAHILAAQEVPHQCHGSL